MSDSSKSTIGIGLILSFLVVAAVVGILLGGAVSSCFWGLMDGCDLRLVDKDGVIGNNSDGSKKSGKTGSGGSASYEYDANLRKKDLRKKDLSDLDLSEADLREADLRYATMRDTNLSEADMRKADLRFADLTGADLSSAKLGGVDFRHANLSLANFEDNNSLRSANFSGAWAWADEMPVGLVGKAAISICDTALQDDYDADTQSGKPKGC